MLVGFLLLATVIVGGSAAMGSALPDGRSYELVSPAVKGGSDVMSNGARTRAASDGSAVQFLSLGAFGDAQGTGISTEYMAIRAGDGWKTHSITPLHEPQSAANIISAFDPQYTGDLSSDLTTGVYRSKTPLSHGDANVEGVTNLYLRRDLRTPGSGSYQLITKAANPVTAPSDYRPVYAGASADFSHLLFMSTLNLTPDAPAQTCGEPGANNCNPRLYEFTGGGVSLVGLIPIPPDTSCSGSDCVPAGRSIPGQTRVFTAYVFDAISRDGRRIVFTVPGSTFGTAGALFVREDQTRTVQVNVSEKTFADAPAPATFQDASADGSKIFFTTDEQLVNDDTNTTGDLYRYDLDAPLGHRLTLLSVDHEPGDAPSPGVQGVYGVSADGSYVYFSMFSQLVAGGPLIRPGEKMVFVWHNGSVAFVGTVGIEDDLNNSFRLWGLRDRLARVTPDGRHLVFSSSTPDESTGDSSAACARGVGGDTAPCRRVYVYTADANGGVGALACVSCHPDGAPSTTDATVMALVANGGTSTGPHLNHPISSDGSRVFFSTGDALVPEDRNGSRYDVYEYDVASGQVHLISGGTGGDSYFMDASSDGSDVFFTTRERLVGSDQDSNVDLYDARIGGGFPEPPSAPAPCPDAEACKGVVPAAPADATPGSVSFLGPEDSLPASALPVFSVGALTRSQLRRLAAGAGVSVAVRVSGAGRVSVRLRGTLEGRARSAGAAARTAHRGGVVRLRVTLAAWALAKLRRDERLRLAMIVRYGPVPAVQRQLLTLTKLNRGAR